MLFIVAKRSSVSGDPERAIKPRHLLCIREQVSIHIEPFPFLFRYIIYTFEKEKKYNTIEILQISPIIELFFAVSQNFFPSSSSFLFFPFYYLLLSTFRSMNSLSYFTPTVQIASLLFN